MIVKVCGMREAENIRQVEALRPDWMGFIFWPKSSRYVSVMPGYLPTRAKRVGVFVDQDIAEIKRVATDYALDIIQLHGNESPAFVSLLRDWHVVKAFSIATEADLDATRDYDGLVDYFLFDTRTPLVGGSGQQFNWDVLDAYRGATHFLLSGGIGPDDASRIRHFHHPRMAGIDLNSRFELLPAVKDVNLLKRFLHEQD